MLECSTVVYQDSHCIIAALLGLMPPIMVKILMEATYISRVKMLIQINFIAPFILFRNLQFELYFSELYYFKSLDYYMYRILPNLRTFGK